MSAHRIAIPIPIAIACGSVAAARIATAELAYQTHWIGHDGTAPPRTAVATALAVAHDGTCWLAGRSLSGTPGISEIRQGEETGRHFSLDGPGWGGGTAVAANDSHIYLAVTLTGVSGPSPTAGPQPPASPAPGTTWHGVYRFNRDGTPAAVPGGRGPAAAFRVIHESANHNDNASKACAVTGLWRHDDELFVSDRAANRVRVMDAATLMEKRVFRATQPGPLCVLDGQLQVVERDAVVTAYSLDGRATGQVLDEGADFVPEAVAPTPDGRLLVADRGATQQAHLFNMSGVPTRVRTLGDEGGMLGPPAPGEVGPRRLANLAGVGVDAEGNYYVAMNPPPAGRVLRALAPDPKSLRWQVSSIAITDGADFDPLGDGLDIYSLTGRHALDLTKPPGQSWRWVSQSVDPWVHADDPRLGHAISHLPESRPAASGSPLAVQPTPHALASPPMDGTVTYREIDGKRLLFHRTSDGWTLIVWRLQGHTAVPGLVIHGAKEASHSFALPGQPASGSWGWRDTDGNGRPAASEFAAAPATLGRFATSPVDASGGLWRLSGEGVIHYWPCRGCDAQGLPRYDDHPSQSTPPPASLTHPTDLHYDAANKTLYLSGYGPADPDLAVASSIARIDGWGTGETARTAWETSLPMARPPVIHSADHLVFTMDPDTAVVHVLREKDGLRLGTLQPPPSPATSPAAHRAPALRAHRRRDGSYVVLIQDPWFPRALVHHVEATSVP